MIDISHSKMIFANNMFSLHVLNCLHIWAIITWYSLCHFIIWSTYILFMLIPTILKNMLLLLSEICEVFVSSALCIKSQYACWGFGEHSWIRSKMQNTIHTLNERKGLNDYWLWNLYPIEILHTRTFYFVLDV